ASNIIGLNISSAFNSAITIYILIPIILIPQLIFSGVVFPFEKLNPNLTPQERVPIYGELMTSRWAYEAAMVKQFKSNKYEKLFYDLDKEIHVAEYKVTYLVPELLLHLNMLNPSSKNSLSDDEKAHRLGILKNELAEEILAIGREKFPDFENLNAEEFDEKTYQNTRNFLETLRKLYVIRRNEKLDQRNALLSRLTQSEADKNKLLEIRKKYKNDFVNQVVKGLNEKTRIMEVDGHLVRKIYPIYFDPKIPENKYNFRTHFYAPTKYFAGYFVDTYFFNLMVIWSMTLLLFFALYFDVFRFLVVRFESAASKPIPYYMKKNRNYIKKRIYRSKLKIPR